MQGGGEAREDPSQAGWSGFHSRFWRHSRYLPQRGRLQVFRRRLPGTMSSPPGFSKLTPKQAFASAELHRDAPARG